VTREQGILVSFCPFTTAAAAAVATARGVPYRRRFASLRNRVYFLKQGMRRNQRKTFESNQATQSLGFGHLD